LFTILIILVYDVDKIEIKEKETKDTIQHGKVQVEEKSEHG